MEVIKIKLSLRTKVNNRLGLDLRTTQFSEQIRRTVPQLNFPPNFNGNVILLRGNSRIVACSRLYDSGETRKWKASKKSAVRGKVSSRFIFVFALSRFSGLHSVSNPGTGYNLGENQMEQQTPIPLKSRMKPRAGWGQKRAIFPHPWFGGGGRGGSRFSIYFVQDCTAATRGLRAWRRQLTCRQTTYKIKSRLYPFVALHELPRFSLLTDHSRTSPQGPGQNKEAVVESWSLLEVWL